MNISKVKSVLALASAVCGLQLSAATPVAVWDGDFDVTTKGGYTLNLNNNSVSDGVITINQSKGVQIDIPGTDKRVFSVLVRYSALNQSGRGSETAAVASMLQGKTDSLETASEHDVGVYGTTTKFAGFYDDNTTDYGALTYTAPESGCFLLSYSAAGEKTGGDNQGVRGYFGTKSSGTWAWSNRIGADGLRFTSDTKYISKIAVGGSNTSTKRTSFTGMKIEAVAVFDSRITTDDAASYMFPSELSKMYANRLSGDTAVVTPGTYGAITVPGAGYKATAYAAATQLPMSGSSEEVSGSYATIIRKPSNDTDIYVHTFAGWFKIDALPTATGAAGAKTIYAVKSADDNYGGYKVAVGSDGKIYVGQCDNEAWRNDSGRSTVVTTAGKIEAGKWFHLAVSIPGRVSARTTTATIFFNGEKVATSGGPFGTNLNGNGCSYARIGEKGVTSGLGISAAGIYVDTRAIDNAKAVISAANGFVVAAPYQATVTQSANWANLNWVSGKKPTDGAEVKLIRSGDAASATVTIDESVNLAKLTVASASGKSLTLKVDNALAATTYDFSGTVKIGGAGRVAYTSASVPTVTTWTWVADGDDEWTGTFAWSGFNNTADNWNLTSYYNGTKSKFEFNGTVTGGYFYNGSFSVGELVIPEGKSIKFTDGHTGEINHYCFTRLSGAGTFEIATSSTASPCIKITDVSAFCGTFKNTSGNSDGGYRVIMGDGAMRAKGDIPTKAAIHFTGNVALDAFTLNASKGVRMTNEVALVFADADSKLTVNNSSVTVADGQTIPVKITNAADLTAGKELITWTGSAPAGDFSLEASGVAVGEKGFKAAKGSNALTVAEDTATTYYAVGDIESGTVTTVTFEDAWLVGAGVKETGSSTVEVQANLNAENANGIKMSDVYLMGYEAGEAQNAAVILRPDQAQSNGENISLSVAGVPDKTRNGAVITYTALADANRDWGSPSKTVPMSGRSVSMALPTSGVLYYRIQANVALP